MKSRTGKTRKLREPLKAAEVAGARREHDERSGCHHTEPRHDPTDRATQPGAMVFKFNVNDCATISKTVRFVPEIAPPHSGNGAKFRKLEASLEPLVIIGDEAIIEVDVVGDEDDRLVIAS